MITSWAKVELLARLPPSREVELCVEDDLVSTPSATQSAPQMKYGQWAAAKLTGALIGEQVHLSTSTNDAARKVAPHDLGRHLQRMTEGVEILQATCIGSFKQIDTCREEASWKVKFGKLMES
jgi:hypothetical protein